MTFVGPPCWRLGCMPWHHCTHLRSCEIQFSCSDGKLFICVALGCANRSPKDSKRGISFHCLPLKDKGPLSKWLAQIKRENLPQIKHCHVCSDHFDPTCFKSEYRLDILPDNLSRRHLKGDAIPTVFQHRKKLSLRPFSKCWRNRALHEEVSHVFAA